jgi:hypothetical protein
VTPVVVTRSVTPVVTGVVTPAVTRSVTSTVGVSKDLNDLVPIDTGARSFLLMATERRQPRTNANERE